jgi:hypothetical protein
MRSAEVQGAGRNVVGPVEQGKLDGAQTVDEDRIVLVRPAVVERLEHVFGNLFQRIYHLTEQVRERDEATAGLLSDNIRQLEDFLQLAMDYFSPLPLKLEFVPAIEVAQSLAREISDAVGCPVKIDARQCSGRLLVDPGRLVRAFGLLTAQLGPAGDGQASLEIRTAVRPSARSVVLSMSVPSDLLLRRAPAAEMQWTVAEKVLESHGGALTQGSAVAGEVLWEIVLPLQS